MPTCETTVLGGLPVTIEYTMSPAEPDVGIPSPYISDWHITHIKNRPAKSTNWIYKRLEANPNAEAALLDSIYQHDADDHDFD